MCIDTRISGALLSRVNGSCMRVHDMDAVFTANWQRISRLHVKPARDRQLAVWIDDADFSLEFGSRFKSLPDRRGEVLISASNIRPLPIRQQLFDDWIMELQRAVFPTADADVEGACASVGKLNPDGNDVCSLRFILDCSRD